MKPRTLLLAALAAASLDAAAALPQGAIAPDFTAPAALAGKRVSYVLHEALAHGPVVVYFYPSAYTGGCNIEAHTFALEYDKFASAGIGVVGVSLDSVERLVDFSADPDYCAGKVTVASDAGGAVAKSFELAVRDAQAGKKDTRGDAIEHGFAERTTFVVASDGRIVATIGGVNPAEHVAQALAAAQRLVRH